MEGLVRIALAICIATLLAYRGFKRRSLSLSGSIAAFIVGLFSFGTSYCHGTILIVFYLTSTRVTKIREDIKAKLEVDYRVGGQRNYIQVFANSVLASLIAILHFSLIKSQQYSLCPYSQDFSDGKYVNSLLWLTYIAHYACANGDTWASELGVLARRRPRLISSLFLRTVPPGTNGGMSIEGTVPHDYISYFQESDSLHRHSCQCDGRSGDRASLLPIHSA